MSGSVPTASGFHRHRAVDRPEAAAALEWVLDSVEGAGAVPVAHCCAPGFPIGLVRGAGARGISVDLSVLDAAAYDALAEAVEAGEWVLLGAVPSLPPATPPTDANVAERVSRVLDMLGLEPGEHADRLVLTPACGLAGADPAWARRALELARDAAAHM
jgi:hypothetical protein